MTEQTDAAEVETWIWREGGRVRAHDGMGYSDRVPDERIATYAADEGMHECDRAFAAAVLAIRRFEAAARAAAAAAGGAW